MGPGPPWSPEAPPKSVQRTWRAPPCLAPTGVAAGGLAWARTSGGALQTVFSTLRHVEREHVVVRGAVTEFLPLREQR